MLRDRSEIVPVDASQIPQALKDAPRWAIWKAEPKPQRDGTVKLDKVPYRSFRPFVHAKSNDPASWSTFEAAYAAYNDRANTGADGLLFALGDGHAAVDLDDAVVPATGAPTPEAREVIDLIDSYAERSVSGMGVRIFAFGPEVKGIHFGSREIYSRYRFMTVTGQHISGTSEQVEHRELPLDALRQRLGRERMEAAAQRRRARGGDEIFSTGDAGPVVDAATLGVSDAEIIDTGYDMDGFAELWRGSTAAYDGDASRADLALAGRLAFLCGPDQHERVRRLMEQSGLVREKWFTHRTYLMELTIAKAYEEREDYYAWDHLSGFGNRYDRIARRVAEAGSSYDDRRAGGTATSMQILRASAAEHPASDARGDERPTIVLGPETDALLHELEHHMAPHLYQQSGRLVRVERRDTAAASEVLRRPREAHQIVSVPHEMTQRLLSRHVCFVTTETTGQGKQRKSVTKQTAAPANLAKLFTNCGSWANIPHLVGITSTPFMRRDGEIVGTPGFDPVSGYLFIDDGTAWEPVPADPTHEQVLAAVDALLEVVCDFPFEKPEHRSAWLSAMLTAVGRPAIYGPVPMLWVDGNRKGTGKSKLPRLISGIACGHDPTEIGFTSEEKELENRLLSLLLGGDRVAAFDNAVGSLRNPVLDRFLTSTIFSARGFFKQEIVKRLNNTVLAVTGNNLTLRGDLSRRVLRVRLVTPLERPDRRDDFRHPDLFGFVRRNRPRLVAAALTILRAHAASGFQEPLVRVTKPDGTVACEPARPVGSFREWDVVVRHAMLRIGLPDPARTQDEAHEQDEGEIKLLAFLSAWHAWLGPKEVTATQLIREAGEEPSSAGKSPDRALDEKAMHADYLLALLELTETEPGRTPSAQTLGYRLRENVEKPIGGYRLVKQARGRDGIRYKVIREGN